MSENEGFEHRILIANVFPTTRLDPFSLYWKIYNSYDFFIKDYICVKINNYSSMLKRVKMTVKSIVKTNNNPKISLKIWKKLFSEICNTVFFLVCGGIPSPHSRLKLT